MGVLLQILGGVSSAGVCCVALLLSFQGTWMWVTGCVVAVPVLAVHFFVVQRDLQAILKAVLLFQSIMILVIVLQYDALEQHDVRAGDVSAKTKSIGMNRQEPEKHRQEPVIPDASLRVIQLTFGIAQDSALGRGKGLLASSFPDLLYRSPELVRSKFPRLFAELPTPEAGFMADFKNPCWISPEEEPRFVCLPYFYLLGLPKCGTTDLFLRLAAHPEIEAPRKKEIRWLTRGEFTFVSMQEETETAITMDMMKSRFYMKRLGSASSVYTFTQEFDGAAKVIAAHPSTRITMDGGPHTLWWPTQSPDGTFLEDVPPAQILREMQPNAKFIITLQDPVKRMYSDYFFLDDNLQVHDTNVKKRSFRAEKSPADFHNRAEKQINRFKKCVSEQLIRGFGVNAALREYSTKLGSLLHKIIREGVQMESYLDVEKLLLQHWFRASQACAHDRHLFGLAGWGRLSIGLYALFYEKWLEHFEPSQFLLVRLEDFALDSRAYMQNIFKFLELSTPSEPDWNEILFEKIANEHHAERGVMFEQTASMLREFYQPYNNFLATMLNEPRLAWLDDDSTIAQTGAGDKGHDIEGAPGFEKGKEIESTSAHINNHGPRAVHREPEPHEAMAIKANRYIMGGKKRANLAASLQVAPQKVEPMKMQPRNFSLQGLPHAREAFNEWIGQGKFINRTHRYLPHHREAAAAHLCTASFALDLAALKYLLHDIGLPANLVDEQDSHRNAFHCLALVPSMTEAHPQSHLFTLLKNRTSWLTEYIDPPIRLSPTPHSQSVYVRDIIDGLNKAVVNAAKWLARAGTPAGERDATGSTPLHMAASSGQIDFLKFLLQTVRVPVDPNNNDKRTPLHYAVFHGHVEAAALLVAGGADMHAKDKFGTSPHSIVSTPGPVSAKDALKYFHIKQKAVRTIERFLHPELNASSKLGWAAGTGGWGTKRLKGFEEHISCDLDQYFAHEVTPEFIFTHYVAKMVPVLVRGMFSGWDAIERYRLDNLLRERGKAKVTVSDIPYAEKFGGNDHADMTLQAYIEEVKNHHMLGGSHPWYIFRGHPIPKVADSPKSFVPYSSCPTPRLMQYSFEQLAPPDQRNMRGVASRKVFINAQWAMGGEGTGAPVHFHNMAWNALIYGAKEWFLYPPHSTIMSNRQILEFLETDLLALERRGVQPLRCVQTAGDAILVPENWGHGVVNLQDSVAIATESRFNEFRIKPWGRILNRVPLDHGDKISQSKRTSS